VAKVDTGCVETGETFPHVEISFRLEGVEGNPFAAEVWGIVDRPDGPPVRVPAFYDGGDTWRVRYTPDRLGVHRVRVATGPAGAERPADAIDLSPDSFDVFGDPQPGFVRRSGAHVQRFAFDDGTPYFPLGYNVGWGKPELFEAHHEAMRAAGIDWSRHWMAVFARLALDWNSFGKPLPEGHLDLEVARTWDRVVRSAEASGIRFQFVLQHHGQYSTTVNPNWGACPWAAAKGGFLKGPEEFFTHPKALEITRMKYRYIVARWGYSTAVMAWELFNEVQACDAYWKGRPRTYKAAPDTIWVRRPAPAEVYRTCLERDPSFRIPVPDGPCLVRMHFYCEGDDRAMSVDLGRGAVVGDVLVPAGEPFVHEVDNVPATGGRGVEIAFAGKGGNGFCSGIDILAIDGTFVRIDCGPPASGVADARSIRGWESAERYALVGPKVVARWHSAMAAYIRSIDPWRHLVTTSAFGPESPVSAAMDFHQPHVYRDDMIAAVAGFGAPVRAFDRPVFYGEIGDRAKRAFPADHVPYNHSMLWSGLIAGGAGAAQQWFWERMPLMYDDYRAARRFLDAAGFARKPFRPVDVVCRSRARAPLVIVPRGGFNAGRMFVHVPSDGSEPEGLDRMPPYLHGAPSKVASGFAHELFFIVDSRAPSVFSMTVDTVAKAGAEAELRIDGRQVASVRWPAGLEDLQPDETITLRVPRGRRVVSVRSTGADWFRVGSYRFSGAAPALGGAGCAAGGTACVWLYNRLGVHAQNPRAIQGTVDVAGFAPGTYDVQWWDTRRGVVFARGVARADGAGRVRLRTPPIARDAAILIKRLAE
jgi:hypothetical protein